MLDAKIGFYFDKTKFISRNLVLCQIICNFAA